MAIIKEEWRASPEEALNVTAQDFATGSAIVQFYGGQTADDAGVKYILQSYQFDPWHTLRADGGDEDNSGRYNIYTLGGSDASVADLDFDTGGFGQPRTIMGKCTLNVPFGFDPGVSTDIFSLYVIGTVYHVRGGTETSIGTDTSSTLTISNDGTTITDGMVAFSFDLTETRFKKDDILRVNLNIHAWRSTGSGTCSIIVMTDPYARDVSATGGSSSDDEVAYDGGRPLSFFIPVKKD